jgi:hypothetical protein
MRGWKRAFVMFLFFWGQDILCDDAAGWVTGLYRGQKPGHGDLLARNLAGEFAALSRSWIA